jgi:predicted RNase H-like nuclease (RuvC/YqgF family)
VVKKFRMKTHELMQVIETQKKEMSEDHMRVERREQAEVDRATTLTTDLQTQIDNLKREITRLKTINTKQEKKLKYSFLNDLSERVEAIRGDSERIIQMQNTIQDLT